MKRLLAALLLVASPALAQEAMNEAPCRMDGTDCGGTYVAMAPPSSATLGCVGVFLGSPLNLQCDAPVYTVATKTLSVPYGTVAASNFTATALPTPGAITVTPVLSKVASITTVAGSALVDGDYFTVEYGPGLTVPIEFDATPGDGTTGGRVPLVFAPGDSADTIRDAIIALLNAAVPASLTASSGGAATVSIVSDTPGAAMGTLTENVTDGTFAVSGFADPTHATTVTYYLVGVAPDGSLIGGGPASTTTLATATLSAANYLHLTWALGTGWASARVYRTVAPTTPATTGVIYAGTALALDDTGLAGGAETAPTANGTGVVTAAGFGALVKTERVLTGDGTYAAPSVAPSAAPTMGLHFDATYTYLSAQSGATEVRVGGSEVRIVGATAIYGEMSIYSGPLGVANGIRGSKSTAIVDATPTAFATLPIADGATYSGEITYAIKAVKGTALQVLKGRVQWSATREGAVYTTSVSEVGSQTLAAAAGTLTGSITVAGAAGVVTFSANFDTSQASPDTFTISHRHDSLDAGLVITPLP